LKASFSPEARLAFLWQASHALSSSLDYQTTLRAVARLLVPTLADWCAVDLADDRGKLERLALVHADPERERWGWELHRRYPPDPDLPRPEMQVFRTGRSLLLPDVPEPMEVESAGDAEPLRLLRELRPTSVMIVPLSAREHRLGTITLVTSESGRKYGPEELALVEELAGRAGLAVEHARLYLAEQRARAEAEAAADRSARLLTLSAALARGLSAEGVAATSLELALPALGAWAGSFYVLSPARDALQLLHYHGYPEDAVAAYRRIPLDAPIPLADALRGEPIFVESRARWAERYPHLEAARARTGSGSAAAVPLVSNGRAIGVIGLSFRGEQAFTADDREFVLILAGHCAQALDRVQAATALQDSEARFRSVVESGMLGIAFWDGDGVTDGNDELLQLLGYDREDLQSGRLRHEVLTPPEYGPADLRAYHECLERGICRPYEKEFFRKDGSRVPVLVGGSLLGRDRPSGVFFVLDLTDRRRAEAQVQAAQRMEAVGRLAGGVAHEINNALQGVLGFASFVRRSLPADDPRLRDLAEIEKAGTRAADITHQLLAFSRRQVRQPRNVDVRRVATEFAPMLQQALGPERDLALSPSDAAATVHADRGQLEQVLLNLTLNARDATQPGGRLVLSVDRVTVGPTMVAAVQTGDALEHPPPGEYVRIEARDTGAGMSAGVRERVFEPFFTTKAHGKGTGLGLSVVYGIVRQSGGFITVESEPGRGSAFRIHLPAGGPAEPIPVAAAPAPPGGNSEVILVVDDEPSVLAVSGRTLEEAGYHVITAGNGEEALQVLARRAEVALVVTDMLMPVLGGEELARRVAADRPDMRFLFTSGHPDNGGAFAEDGRRVVLDKPFGPEQLLAAVRERLDGRDGKL
jgi:two-component system cell cycle sensor histidine kinase/response regulator CckA